MEQKLSYNLKHDSYNLLANIRKARKFSTVPKLAITLGMRSAIHGFRKRKLVA